MKILTCYNNKTILLAIMIGNIVFRVDTSKKSGFGHIMRCFALAEELKQRGNSCFFLSEEIDYYVKKKLQKSRIVHQNVVTDVTSEEDVDYVVRFSKEHKAQWIVTDQYGIDQKYIKSLKKHGFHVLSIDDTSQMHYESDVVVNQNIGAEKLQFSGEPYTSFLIGPQYILVRDELLKKGKKRFRENIKKILVTFGASDNDDYIFNIVKSLLSITEGIEMLLVISPYNRLYSDLEEYVKDAKTKIKVIKSPENMGDLYVDTDIAISAGGTSCYELAYFGIPNLIITVADNQLNIARELDRHHVSIYVGREGEITQEKLEISLRKLINNSTLRHTMRLNGKKLVDGKGKKRIVDFLEKINM